MYAPKLGLSLATLSETLDESFLNQLKTSSVATLEINPVLFPDNDSVKLFKTFLSDSDIKVATMHLPYGTEYDLTAIDEKLRRKAILHVIDLIPLAIECETDLLVIHPSWEPIPDEERKQRIAQGKRSCAELEPVLRRNNCKLALELLPRTCIGNTAEELLEIIVDTDPEIIGTCLDVNHLMERYADLPQTVRVLGSRLLTLHISDYDGIDEKHWLPGEGVIDWKEFFRALNDISYSGPFNYECKLGDKTPVEILHLIEDNFKTILPLAEL